MDAVYPTAHTYNTAHLYIAVWLHYCIMPKFFAFCIFLSLNGQFID
jgi:hypothetical protein